MTEYTARLSSAKEGVEGTDRLHETQATRAQEHPECPAPKLA